MCENMICNVTTKRSNLLSLYLLLLAIPQISYAEISFSEGLLFRIENSGATASYIFGTMHTEDKRVLALPPLVKEAFDGSSKLALEIKPGPAMLLAAMMAMSLQKEKQLSDILDETVYRRCAQAMESKGVSEEALRRLKPWAVALTLSLPPTTTGQFLDLVLYEQSLLAGRDVVGLETVQEQLSVFDEMPERDQVALLVDTLDKLELIPDLYKKMLETYLRRDLAGLVKMSQDYFQGGDAALAQRFQSKIIDKRNLRMVERLQPLLAKGNIFVGVGALHLPGRLGILQLLEARGYRVFKVY